MNIRTAWLAVAALFLLAAINTNAQEKHEFTPFVGYETSGSYPVNGFQTVGGTSVPIDKLRANDGAAIGAFFDYGFTEYFEPEFMWNHNNTSYSARDILTNSYFHAFHSKIDQFQFGGIFLLRCSEYKLRPYFGASL